MFNRHHAPIHCTRLEKNLSRHLCTMIKRSHNWTENCHTCILALIQNLFYMHQAPMVFHHCTRFEENQSCHFWEITLDRCTDVPQMDIVHFKIPSGENLWEMINKNIYIINYVSTSHFSNYCCQIMWKYKNVGLLNFNLYCTFILFQKNSLISLICLS